MLLESKGMVSEGKKEEDKRESKEDESWIAMCIFMSGRESSASFIITKGILLSSVKLFKRINMG